MPRTDKNGDEGKGLKAFVVYCTKRNRRRKMGVAAGGLAM